MLLATNIEENPVPGHYAHFLLSPQRILLLDFVRRWIFLALGVCAFFEFNVVNLTNILAKQTEALPEMCKQCKKLPAFYCFPFSDAKHYYHIIHFCPGTATDRITNRGTIQTFRTSLMLNFSFIFAGSITTTNALEANRRSVKHCS